MGSLHTVIHDADRNPRAAIGVPDTGDVQRSVGKVPLVGEVLVVCLPISYMFQDAGGVFAFLIIFLSISRASTT